MFLFPEQTQHQKLRLINLSNLAHHDEQRTSLEKKYKNSK